MFGFPFYSTREDLSIGVSIITTVGLIAIDEAKVISFLGVRTDLGVWIDRHCFGILLWTDIDKAKVISAHRHKSK